MSSVVSVAPDSRSGSSILYRNTPEPFPPESRVHAGPQLLVKSGPQTLGGCGPDLVTIPVSARRNLPGWIPDYRYFSGANGFYVSLYSSIVEITRLHPDNSSIAVNRKTRSLCRCNINIHRH